MEKIPTAEDFLWNGGIITQGDTEPYGKLPNNKVPLVMIEFAKLHVEAALKVAFLNSEMRVSENDTNEYPSFTNNYDDGYVTITVNADSILNAYPLDKIK